MTILVQQLRERALKATPGPWQHERLGIIQGGPMQTYVNGEAMPQLLTSHGADFMEPGDYLANADFVAAANPAAILALLDQVEQLEKSLKLVQSHAHTAYTRGRQAGIADQERTAREAIAAMDLARDQMMDENERFTDLLEKAEQERDQLKAENAAFEEGCRKLAFQLSAGGYNADHLTANQLIAKVQGGLDLFCESTSGWVQKVQAERDQLKAENAELKAQAGLQALLPELDEALEDLEIWGRHSDQGYRKLKDWYRKVSLACRNVDIASTKEQQP